MKSHLHVDLRHASNEQLQLPLIEHHDEVTRHEFEESSRECIKLVFYPLQDSVMDDCINVLRFVFFCHSDLAAIWFEVNVEDFSKPLLGRRECLVQNVGDVIITAARCSVPLSY